MRRLIIKEMIKYLCNVCQSIIEGVREEKLILREPAVNDHVGGKPFVVLILGKRKQYDTEFNFDRRPKRES
jgi:hypothetical protein